jgi:hypothetical protein
LNQGEADENVDKPEQLEKPDEPEKPEQQSGKIRKKRQQESGAIEGVLLLSLPTGMTASKALESSAQLNSVPNSYITNSHFHEENGVSGV